MIAAPALERECRAAAGEQLRVQRLHHRERFEPPNRRIRPYRSGLCRRRSCGAQPQRGERERRAHLISESHGRVSLIVNKTRLEAFSDGVIAILITIMVLELKIPQGANWEALRPLVP